MASTHDITKNKFNKIIKWNVEQLDQQIDYTIITNKIEQIIGTSDEYEKLKKIKSVYEGESPSLNIQTDYKKMMIDEATNIITGQSFKYYGFEKFIHYVYKNLKAMISGYTNDNSHIVSDSVIVLLKGGNINRKIISKFIKGCEKTIEFDRTILKKINEYTNNIYDRSDADFCIYVNKEAYDVKTYEKIIEDLKFKTFNLLRILRNDIYEFKPMFFNVEKMNDITSIILNKLNNNHSLKHIYYENNDVPIHIEHVVFDGKDNNEPLQYPPLKKDMIISFESTNEPIYIKNDNTMKTTIIKTKYVKSEGDKIFYVSMNDTVAYTSITPTNEHHSSVFSLIRMKMSFKLEGKNIPLISGPKPTLGENIFIGGELIDVSIPDLTYAGEKKELKHFFDYQFKNIDTYDVSSLYGQGHVTGISNYYLIYDLHKILFIMSYPWNDNKYLKRLKRFFIAIAIEMVKEKENISYYLLLVIHYRNILNSYLTNEIYLKIFEEKPRFESILVSEINNMLSDIPRIISLSNVSDPKILLFIRDCLNSLDLLIDILRQFINYLTYNPVEFYRDVNGIQLGGYVKYRLKI